MPKMPPSEFRLDDSKILGARIGALGTKIGLAQATVPVPVEDETTSTPFNTADTISGPA